jgi:phosphocarrier protein
MGLMMLAAAQGTPLELATNGENEEAAMKALVDLIADRFGESE